MDQLRLDFGESAEAALAAERQIRASRAVRFEAAAQSIGVRPGEVAYRLAGLLAVYVDSPSMRARGLNGLKWVGTLAELADDARMQCSADSVSRALRRFRAAGLIETGKILDDRGRICGVVVELNMRAIAAAADASCRTVSEVRMQSHESPTRGVADCRSMTHAGVHSVHSKVDAGIDAGVDSKVGAGVGAVVGVDPRIDLRTDPRKSPLHSIPFSSVNSVNPPPTPEPESHQAATAELNEDWTAVRAQLRAVGVERVNGAIRIAKDAGMRADEVLQVLDEYRSNAHRIRSPGAIVDRLRTGDWPVSIGPSVARTGIDDHRRVSAEKLAYEHARAAVIERARREGRWDQLTEEDVQRCVQILLKKPERVFQDE
jgi:hypothetical protein